VTERTKKQSLGKN